MLAKTDEEAEKDGDTLILESICDEVLGKIENCGNLVSRNRVFESDFSERRNK